MNFKLSNLIFGIEISSTKVVAVVAEVDENNVISLIGVGRANPNNGVRNGGVIVNIDSVSAAINDATLAAEMQAGQPGKYVIIGFSSTNVESINSNGIVAISNPDREIKPNDIDRVIENAKTIQIPVDKEIIHIIPQSYLVDNQDEIKMPIGMVGRRLECKVHIITCPTSSIQNIERCIERSGLEIENFVLQNIAASKAVLTDEEKELGVLMLDIGAETTKASVYYKQYPYYNNIYCPLGGNLITNDIMAGLKIPVAIAEKIKVSYGIAHEECLEKGETIIIPETASRKEKAIEKEILLSIIKARLEEMFITVKNDLRQKKMLDKITSGVVITGGTSQLIGITELASDVFNLPARMGFPKKFSGLGDQLLSPDYAVASGLVIWRAEKYMEEMSGVLKRGDEDFSKKKNIIRKVKDIFNKFF